MPKGTVVERETGKKWKLAPREEAGLVECPGEAHSNPFIDNCMLCAPRWGQMMSYKPTPLAACLEEGFAVSVNSTYADSGKAAERLNSGTSDEFKAAEKEGKVRMVMVTETCRSHTSSFFAWVKA